MLGFLHATKKCKTPMRREQICVTFESSAYLCTHCISAHGKVCLWLPLVYLCVCGVCICAFVSVVVFMVLVFVHLYL